MPDRRFLLALAALALALNLVGIGWGLPSRFHPDEKADVVASMVDSHRPWPESYINPSLPLYAAVPVVLAQQTLRAARLLPEAWADPLLASRALSALAGALGVLLLGLAVRRAHSGVGLAAPLLLALAPGVVNLCHFATPEAFVLLATAAVLLLAVRHVQGTAPAWALGLSLGLAASTKYTAAALAAPVLAALWLRPRDSAPPAPDRIGGSRASLDRGLWLTAGAASLALGLVLAGPVGGAVAARLRLEDVRLLHPESARSFVSGLARAATVAGLFALVLEALASWSRTAAWAAPLARREVVAAAAAALAGFLLGTPGAVFEPRRFLSDLAFNAQTRHEYKGLVGAGTSYVPYLGLLGDALTWPVLVAAGLGLGIVLIRLWGRVGGSLRRAAHAAAAHPECDRVALVVALAAVAPYLLVASSGHRAMRFVTPGLPATVWLAALALARIPDRRGRRLVTAAVAARAGLAALLVVRLFFVDSRLLAERWMAANVPVGATVDVITNHEGYVPRVPEGRNARLLRTLSREMAPPERFEEAASAYPSEASDWLVLTGSFYERFLEHPEQHPERTCFFRDLLEGRGGFEIRARFRQDAWLRPSAEFLDPEIVVLRWSGPPRSGAQREDPSASGR